MPAYENYIFPHKDKCDMVVFNDGPADKNIQTIVESIYSEAHPTVLDVIVQ
jgi:hypothetical protein